MHVDFHCRLYLIGRFSGVPRGFAGSGVRIALAHQKLAGPADILSLCNRQLSRLSREYHRLIRLFLELRRECPPNETGEIEPVPPAQAQQTEDLPPLDMPLPPLTQLDPLDYVFEFLDPVERETLTWAAS